MTRLTAIKTPPIPPPIPIRIRTILFLPPPRTRGQSLTQSSIHLSIIQIVIMPQKLGQRIQIPRVILPRTAEHASPNVIHPEFQHELRGHLGFHPQQILVGDALILPQHFDGFVHLGPLGPFASQVLGVSALAVGGGSDVVLSVLALEDVDGGAFD